MIYKRVQGIVLDNVFLQLPRLLAGFEVILKIEGLNPAGSIKLKTAVELVDSMESAGILHANSRIIESSSGNLGIALGIVCAEKRYPLTIVTDPNASNHAESMMRALGINIVKVTEPDLAGGYLQTRINYIRNQVSQDPRLVWLNQYANKANIAAHRDRTAESLHKELGSPDALVIGVGTSGTLMGCLEYFAFHSPSTRIVAVDSAGSVTFGGKPGTRRIPGIGASLRPEIFQDTGDFDQVTVTEQETIRMCRRIAGRYGLLVGGSTGTALVAAERISSQLMPGSRIVVISPDLGSNYLDTIYSDFWVSEYFPEEILDESKSS